MASSRLPLHLSSPTSLSYPPRQDIYVFVCACLEANYVSRRARQQRSKSDQRDILATQDDAIDELIRTLP